MKKVCSYCGVDMEEIPSVNPGGVSHGICDPCYDHFSRQWLGDGYTLGEFLDDFDAPVLAVDGNARVVAVNRAMAELLGKTSREAFGLLGGTVMECAHARLPEGCGKTVHCRDCTVRNTVTATFATGEAQERVPASLRAGDGLVRFVISTRKRGKAVVLVIEDLGVLAHRRDDDGGTSFSRASATARE